MNKFVIGLLCLILLVIMVATVAAISVREQVDTELVKVDVQDIVIWNIGLNNEIQSYFDQVRASKNFETRNLDIPSFNSDPNIKASVLNRTSVIMIDGNWLIQNNNEVLDQFLNITIKEIGAVIVVGESTSNLYAVLDRAGIYNLGSYNGGGLRNPASYNPFAAGFALKLVTENGMERYVPGIFTCENVSGVDLIENLQTFITHDGRLKS